MDSRQPDLLKPTLISGIAFGIAAAIPFLNFLNCLCCALIWGCGLLAAYLYANASRAAGVAFRPGNGAMVGLVAGAFFAITTTIVNALITLMFGEAIMEAVTRFVSSMPGIPPEVLEMMDKVSEEAGKVSPLSFILGFFLNVLLGAVFSTLGGLLGGAVFKHEPPPPPMTPPPPPPSTDAWGGEPPAGPDAS